jgi:hypothetical protein
MGNDLVGGAQHRLSGRDREAGLSEDLKNADSLGKGRLSPLVWARKDETPALLAEGGVVADHLSLRIAAVLLDHSEGKMEIVEVVRNQGPFLNRTNRGTGYMESGGLESIKEVHGPDEKRELRAEGLEELSIYLNVFPDVR